MKPAEPVVSAETLPIRQDVSQEEGQEPVPEKQKESDYSTKDFPVETEPYPLNLPVIDENGYIDIDENSMLNME